jgi:hypothetical protein
MALNPPPLLCTTKRKISSSWNRNTEKSSLIERRNGGSRVDLYGSRKGMKTKSFSRNIPIKES